MLSASLTHVGSQTYGDTNSFFFRHPVQQRCLRWRWRCKTTALTRSVQQGIVQALRIRGISKPDKSMIRLPCWHFGCFVSGSRKCDGHRMLRGRGAVLYGPRRVGATLFQKWISDMYLLQSVSFFGANSRSERLRSLFVLLTSFSKSFVSFCTYSLFINTLQCSRF